MSICLAAMGLLGIAVGASREATSSVLSRVAVVQLVASAALTALYWWYQITPAFISMVVVTVLFAIAVRTTR